MHDLSKQPNQKGKNKAMETDPWMKSLLCRQEDRVQECNTHLYCDSETNNLPCRLLCLFAAQTVKIIFFLSRAD